MQSRELVTEWLDVLPADHVDAIRSRRDLEMINFFMGNERWILRQLELWPEIDCVVELGAGTGQLISRLSEKFPEKSCIAIDLIERPAGVAAGVEWRRQNALDFQLASGRTMVIANLFLHHLPAAQLAKLFTNISAADALICVEPLRTRLSLTMASLIYPWVNTVTQHDMIASIRAGFIAGELAECAPASWQWDESPHPFGGLRSVAKMLP